MELGLNTFIEKATKIELTQFIKELLNRSESLNLKEPGDGANDAPELWQGFDDKEGRKIICMIKTQFSIKELVKQIYGYYDLLKPTRIVLVILDPSFIPKQKSLLKLVERLQDIITIYDIDNLNSRLRKFPKLQPEAFLMTNESSESSEYQIKSQKPDESQREKRQKQGPGKSSTRKTIKEKAVNQKSAESKKGIERPFTTGTSNLKKEFSLEDIQGFIKSNLDSDKNFWWLNAIQDRWSLESMKVGDSEQYLAKSKNGRLLPNAKNLKRGDLAIGYQGLPDQKIVGVWEITDEYEAIGKVGFRLIYKFKKQTTYEQLKVEDKFSKSPLAKNLTGSFKKLDYDVFVEILNTTELKPIEIIEPEEEADAIPFHLDQVENTDRLNRVRL